MSRKPDLQMIWTLSVLRHGAQGAVDELSEVEFRFARMSNEIEGSHVRTIPGGLISLLTESGLADDAMETGFIIQMSRLQRPVNGWRLFAMLAGDVSWNPYRGGSPRSVYAEMELPGTVEFADTNCCSFLNQLPGRIWIRVLPLPTPTIAWAFSNGIYDCPEGEQRTLHDWVDLCETPSISKVSELVLPGPPSKQYEFL